jgi:hypothetical protein
MFWGDALDAKTGDPVSELRSFLQDGGVSVEEADGLIEALSQRPIPEDTSGPFFISSIQDLLDHLAFETEVDIGKAQEKFLSCWLHLQRAGAVASKDLPTGDPENKFEPQDALNAFDADRAAGVDAETAISRLSERLGLDPDLPAQAECSGGEPPAGLVDGLIAEYLWELSGGNARPSSVHNDCFNLLRAELKHAEVIEDITPRRILLIACTTLCEDPGVGADTRCVYANILSEFSTWCVEHHGHADALPINQAFQSLPGSLARVDTINQVFEPGSITGDWWAISVVDGGLMAVSADDEQHPLTLGARQVVGLVQGDYIRGELTPQGVELSWCYPPELSAAQGSR